MLLSALRHFLRLTLSVFYREIAVEGCPDPGGPLVLVANHPNTLMDALLIGTRIDRKLSIIAKSTLFTGFFQSWLFRSLGALPVKRRQDVAASTESSNDDTFSACYDELAAGGAILIFGEGTSHLEPRLFPLKTGAARIAIGAERSHGPLGVRLIPVGLTYEAPETFAARVQVRCGAPIPASAYLAPEGPEGDRAAAEALTHELERRLSEEVVHLERPELAEVLSAVDGWIGHQLVEDRRQRLDALRQISIALNTLARTSPERLARFRAQLAEYQALLKSEGLSDEDLGAERGPSELALVASALPTAPLWLFGVANNLIPYQTTRVVARCLKLDPTYTATVKLLAGLVLYAGCYGLQATLLHQLAGPEVALGYLVTLPICGFAALFVQRRWHALQARRKRRRRRAEARPDALAQAAEQRATLMANINAAERELRAESDSAVQP